MSQKIEHNRKKKMARKMLTKEEAKPKKFGGRTFKMDVFTSEAWKKRSESKLKKIAKKITVQKKIKKECLKK